MEEKVKISILLGIYGKLLTSNQYEIMDYYYNEDLSLSEIAENNNITRQAVRTILIKSKKKLEQYEEKLKFMEKENNIIKQLEDLEKSVTEEKQKKIIERIKEKIDF